MPFIAGVPGPGNDIKKTVFTPFDSLSPFSKIIPVNARGSRNMGDDVIRVKLGGHLERLFANLIGFFSHSRIGKIYTPDGHVEPHKRQNVGLNLWHRTVKRQFGLNFDPKI
jgi:hypothetical protein